MRIIYMASLAVLGLAACAPQEPIRLAEAPKFVSPAEAGLNAAPSRDPAVTLGAAGDTVYFANGSSQLTDPARAILNAQAEAIKSGIGNIVVEGHSDEQGTREFDIAIGAQRASNVREYLILRGVDADRVTITSFGKERPVATCSNESCWSQNRRVVTRVR